MKSFFPFKKKHGTSSNDGPSLDVSFASAPSSKKQKTTTSSAAAAAAPSDQQCIPVHSQDSSAAAEAAETQEDSVLDSSSQESVQPSQQDDSAALASSQLQQPSQDGSTQQSTTRQSQEEESVSAENPFLETQPVEEEGQEEEAPLSFEDDEEVPLVTEPGADLDGATLAEADLLLDRIYGDHPHDNDGTHLDGGVPDDALWQHRFDQLSVRSPSHYSLPNGRVGKRFVRLLTEEFASVLTRDCNSEKPLVFVMVILQKDPMVRKARDIRRRLEQRLDHWEEGDFDLLVSDTLDSLDRNASVGRKRPQNVVDEARAFHSKLISGRLQQAVRHSIDGEPGGVRLPHQKCTKSGKKIVDVLREKHPDMMDPSAAIAEPDRIAFEPYESTPRVVDRIYTAEVVEKVASQMGGSAGLSGTDAVDCCKWLLRFGEESKELRDRVAEFVSWLANDNPPFAAYRALVACRLVALDKVPGTRPIGIGEIWRRLFTKCVISVCGKQATKAAGDYNLCVGLSAGIEGAVHAMQEKWHQANAPRDEREDGMHLVPPASPSTVAHGGVRSQESSGLATQDDATLAAATAAPTGSPDDEPAPTADAPSPEAGLTTQQEAQASQRSSDSMEEEEEELADPNIILLVDADNAFNSLSRRTMLWTVRHLWPAGSRFVFNMYRHSARQIIRNGAASETILSREGVTQGDPLAMIAYGLGLVPLAKRLRADVPSCLQPWYADDSAAQGRASEVERFFDILLEKGKSVGYHPSPSKCIVICREEDNIAALQRLHRFGFQYRKGGRYIGSYLGSPIGKDLWVKEKCARWERAVRKLSSFAVHYPQSAYAGFARSLQNEWQYVQRVVDDCKDLFVPLAGVIGEFVAAVLGSVEDEGNPLAIGLTTIPVRHGGLGLLDPVDLADINHGDSLAATSHLVQSLLGNCPFDLDRHEENARETKSQRRESLDEMYESRVKRWLTRGSRVQKQRTKRGKDTGGWITVAPSTDNGTILSADEFRDSARLRLGLEPLHMPAMCDACTGTKFTVSHALDCKKGGLVGYRHDHLRATWARLCRQASSRDRVKEEPYIHNSATLKAAKAKAEATRSTPPPPGERGDVAVHDFWTQGTTAIFDIRVTNTECPSRRGQAAHKVLAAHEKEKKDRYLEACLERRRQFTPLVFSVDGLPGAEATAAIKRLSAMLAEKLQREYSVVCGYVRSQLQIALARSASLCIRGARAPFNRANSPLMDGGASLRLYR